VGPSQLLTKLQDSRWTLSDGYQPWRGRRNLPLEGFRHIDSAFSLRDPKTRRAPRLAKAIAVARPIPLDAPVITTTRFLDLSGIFCSNLGASDKMKLPEREYVPLFAQRAKANGERYDGLRSRTAGGRHAS